MLRFPGESFRAFLHASQNKRLAQNISDKTKKKRPVIYTIIIGSQKDAMFRQTFDGNRYFFFFLTLYKKKNKKKIRFT